ncbi:MAG: FAD-dependent oxidoreductase [Rhodothermaceae bacterium]|nr:FAD-dependent oxidoreductase [Rhodothermaceae bacterium]
MASYDYDLAVIGGGAAGLTAAGIAGNTGVKTLMVERDRLGGDCTWTGCVPSKTLLHAASLAHATRSLNRFSKADLTPEVDFPAVVGHVHRLRDEIYEDADAPEIYEGFGVDVVHGNARFIDPHTLEIDNDEGSTRRVTARQFVIATGGRASVPPIDGLDTVEYLTNETLFEIETQPERLVIIGGGPIGAEMAQAFQRLGTQVTVLDRGARLLGRDDPEHAAMLMDVLNEEGVRLIMNAFVKRVAPGRESGVAVHVSFEGKQSVVEGDRLLMATGRQPNVEGLGLEAAGVRIEKKGIVADERCRTSQKHIYAIGDCTGEYQLTHMSEHMAKVAATNAVLKVPMKIDRAHVPWVTYTTPEVAQLGKTEQQLRDDGTDFEVYRFPYTKVDRAITDDATVGQIKVFATKWRGKIFGVSIVGERAGELLGLYAVAMKGGLSLREIADTIIPYPTYALGARRAADQWYVRKQYPQAIKLLQRVFGYRGTVPPPPDPNRIV